jgi:hypothetical protein
VTSRFLENISTPTVIIQRMMNWKAFGRERPWLDRGSDPVFAEDTEENTKKFSLKAVFRTRNRTRHLPNIIPEPYRHTNLLGNCISAVCEQRYITV